MKIMNTTFGLATHTIQVRWPKFKHQNPQKGRWQEASPQSSPPLIAITHIIQHSHTNNNFYLEIKPNAYLSEGMSLAIGCFPPDPFLIEFCLVSPWDRAFSTKGADKSPEGPRNWVSSCSLAFFSCGASSFRSPRRTLWSGCCGVLDPLL